MIARLIPLDDGATIDLNKDLTLVGRNEDCDIRIDHKSISKIHCILVKTDGLVLVRDLGSTNGTRVNGQRVRRAALLPNDQLAIAGYKYRVKFGEGPDEPVREIDNADPIDQQASNDDSSEQIIDNKAGGPATKRNALPDIYPETAKNK